jgi:hypothetical protein
LPPESRTTFLPVRTLIGLAFAPAFARDLDLVVTDFDFADFISCRRCVRELPHGFGATIVCRLAGS